MMKKLKNRFTAGILTSLAVIFTLSSCQKAFNTKSYAPTKPAPTFSGYSASSQIEADSLIDYWNFSSTLTDSISKLPGTASGSSFSTGIFGQGYNGTTSAYAVCKSSPAIASLGNFTVSAWVNTTPPTTGVLDYFTLANTDAFWGNIEMFFDNGSTNADAHLRIHLSNNGTDNTYAAEVPGCFNGWAHLVFSYNITGQCSLYLNGTALSTSGTTVAPDTLAISGGKLKGPLVFQNVGNVVFGCTQFMTTPVQNVAAMGSAQPWAAYFPGKIDQVRVYNKVLSSTEVSALHSLESLGR